MNSYSGEPLTELVIPVTLKDGTRIRLPVDDIAFVEPADQGALIHRDSGETLMVVHDAKTVELRVTVALAGRAKAEEARPDERSEPDETPPLEGDHAPHHARKSLNRREKHLLRARVSLPSLMIGQASRRPKPEGR